MWWLSFPNKFANLVVSVNSKKENLLKLLLFLIYWNKNGKYIYSRHKSFVRKLQFHLREVK